MNLFCFGLSHQTAGVNVRERFAIPGSALPEALARLKAMPGLTEGLVLSTKRTLAVRKQASEKCQQLIEHHVQDFQLWLEGTVIEFPQHRGQIAWSALKTILGARCRCCQRWD
jgi:glutamyl-tRNA reductase